LRRSSRHNNAKFGGNSAVKGENDEESVSYAPNTAYNSALLLDKHETDGWQFTTSAISNALGMGNEEKTMSRVLIELRRVHASKIMQINVRNGKIFQYYYFIKQP